MRKDLVFRYLNSCNSNLSRISIHLLEQEDNSIRTNQENDGIAKESHPEISEIESDFIVSQLESIIETARFLIVEIKGP